MSTSFKIPKRSRSDSDSVQMTSPLSRLQSPAEKPAKGFAPFRDRTLSGNSSSVTPLRGTNSHKLDLKSRLGNKPAEPFSNGWRPKRASDRLLSPVAVPRVEQKNEESSDSAEDSPLKKTSCLSEPPPLRPISVRSLDALFALRAERHHGSPGDDRKRTQDTPPTETSLSWSRVSSVSAAAAPSTSTTSSENPASEKPASEKPASEKPASEKPASEKPASEKPASEKPASEKPASEKPPAEKPPAGPTGATDQSVWSDLSDVREKQREKWRQFKEKKQNRSHATIRTKPQDQNQIQTRTRTRTTASSEPIVLSSEEEEEEEEEQRGVDRTVQSDRSERSQSGAPSEAPPSFLQLDFCSFHSGLCSAQANGSITITESGLSLPLRGADGLQGELCVVASQVRGFGLWDGGVARGGTLFSDSSGPAPSLLFLSVSDAQSTLLQTELREILPHTDPVWCGLLLLELKEQLSDLDSALVLSVLDSGDYRTSRTGPGSGAMDWTEGLLQVHACPAPVDAHLLRLLGQKSPAVRNTRSLRSGAQQLPSRLIQYPAAPSKGRISVSAEDLQCLTQGEFLNDVIIDFYLKYLLLEGVGGAVAERSHVFSSFFYKQLSKRRAAGEDVSVPDRHTRHQRVKTWTRNIDIFNKDFLFIPVNQEAHWFLVLVCFPGLEEPKLVEFSSSSEALRASSGLRSHTPPECTLDGCRKSSVLKRPCVLVLDSLKLSQHEAVCRLIRDYLHVEWESRRGSKRLFSTETFKTCNCRVPQQDNSSDCGLYLLQYAQAFLQNPVVDLELPVRLDAWFPRQHVRDKREEIRRLVLRLHREQTS